MSFLQRNKIYKQIEKIRKRPLIVYVTSNRPNANGNMASDVLPEFMDQLLLLPPKTKSVDLLLVSNGGDPTVAWRIMSLLRERVENVSVLVPQSAFSAATLLALGADEIMMHPCGNLGPVDPQISVKRGNEVLNFGSEDLAAFISFIRDDIGITDQQYMESALKVFIQEVGAVPIGVATRSVKLSASMGEKLLLMHMKEDSGGQKAKTITETLNKNFFHHGYPVGRKEAKEIGLKITYPEPKIESLMWEAWKVLEKDLCCRQPFSPMSEIAKTANGKKLFLPYPNVNIPPNLPPDVRDKIVNNVLSQIKIDQIDPTDYTITNGVLESSRRYSAFKISGKIFAFRGGDLKISVTVTPISSGWSGKNV